MNHADCCLTLVFPRSVEETIVSHLLEHPEWVDGFTINHVDGQGRDVALHSTQEQVRGRAGCVKVQLVLGCDHARALVSSLRQILHSPGIAYWITPVIEFGRFT